MLLGVFAGLITASLTGLEGYPLSFLVAVSSCLISPALLDVLLQIATSYRSNRQRRCSTGFLLGLGIVPLGKALTKILT